MADKTFWKGEWHLVVRPNASDAKGRLGDACAPFVEGEDVKWVAEGAYGASGNFVAAQDATRPLPAAPLPSLGAWAYRVVTQADPWFQGRFSPERLELLLNELAREGWHVAGLATSDRATWTGSPGGGARQEMVILLERVVDEEYLLSERRRRGEGPVPASRDTRS
jgi:hypothetical protein